MKKNLIGLFAISIFLSMNFIFIKRVHGALQIIQVTDNSRDDRDPVLTEGHLYWCHDVDDRYEQIMGWETNKSVSAVYPISGKMNYLNSMCLVPLDSCPRKSYALLMARLLLRKIQFEIWCGRQAW